MMSIDTEPCFGSSFCIQGPALIHVDKHESCESSESIFRGTSGSICDDCSVVINSSFLRNRNSSLKSPLNVPNENIVPRSAAEERQLNLASTCVTRGSKYRQLPCRTYISTGFCPYKDRCVYVHDPRITSSADMSRFKNRKKNKEDICQDSFFWPILINDRSNNSVMTEYNVPSPSDDKYYMHDSAGFSMWNNFVDICKRINLQDNTQHLSGYNHAKARREMCDLTKELENDDNTNRFVKNLPRLSVFQKLSNGELYSSPVSKPEDWSDRIDLSLGPKLFTFDAEHKRKTSTSSSPIALPPKIWTLPAPVKICEPTEPINALDEELKMLSAGARPFTPIIVQTKTSKNDDKPSAISPISTDHGFSPTTIGNIHYGTDCEIENRKQRSPFGSYFDTGFPPIENLPPSSKVSEILPFPLVGAVDHSKNNEFSSVFKTRISVDKDLEFFSDFHNTEQSLLQGFESTERDQDMKAPPLFDRSEESMRLSYDCNPPTLDLCFMKESEDEEDELFEIMEQSLNLASQFQFSVGNSPTACSDQSLKKDVPPGLGFNVPSFMKEESCYPCLESSQGRDERDAVKTTLGRSKTFMSLSDSLGSLRDHSEDESLFD